MNGFDHLYTSLGTANNYSPIADIHTLQITTAPAKNFPACCVLTSRFLATACNSEVSSATRAQVLLSQPLLQSWTELNCQSSVELDCPNCLLYNSSTRTTWKTLFFYCCMPARLHGTCLSSPCSETAVCLSAYCIATAIIVVCFEVFA
jgi:hypothetical protein